MRPANRPFDVVNPAKGQATQARPQLRYAFTRLPRQLAKNHSDVMNKLTVGHKLPCLQKNATTESIELKEEAAASINRPYKHQAKICKPKVKAKPDLYKQVKEKSETGKGSELPTASTLFESGDKEVGVVTVQGKKKPQRGKKYLDHIAALNPDADLDRLKLLLKDMPKVTAKSWAVADLDSSQVVFGFRATVKREVASLTKLMTLFTALDIVASYNIDPDSFSCSVSKYGASLGGTSAGLKTGDSVSLKHLFFGRLM